MKLVSKRFLVAAAAVVLVGIAVRTTLRLTHPRLERFARAEVVHHGESRELLVAVHGMTPDSRKLADVVAVLEQSHPDGDLLVPEFDANPLSNADPSWLAAQLDEVLERAVQARADSGGGYQRILLVGQSAGALLVRKAYVFGRGSREDAPNGLVTLAKPRTWPALVTRIVLMAGLNRGWTLTPRPARRPLWMQLGLRALDGFARLAGVGHFATEVQRGAPFVANLRVQWIRLMSASGDPLPAVYQILGSDDGLVTGEDSQDLVGMPAFLTLVVPGSPHAEIARFDDTSEGKDRREKFEQAVLLPELELARAYAPQDTTALKLQPESPVPETGSSPATAVPRPPVTAFTMRPAMSRAGVSNLLASRVRVVSPSAPTRRRTEDLTRTLARQLERPQALPKEVAVSRRWNLEAEGRSTPRKRIVFVLHGIRDNGQFADRIRRLVEERSHESRDSIDVVTDRYDRLGLLPFLLFGTRNKQVRWFMDRYTEQLARSPGATFTFIGHSNGTFVLAKALQEYRTMRMGNVVFAGSVVPRGFDWQSLADEHPSRIGRVLNVCAAGDFVVAVFPRFYELIHEHLALPGFADIGSAGFSGFEQNIANENEISFVRGGHGAALDSPNVEQLVDFALTGTCQQDAFDRQASPDGWVSLASGLCWLVWFLLVLVVIVAAWLVWRLPPLWPRAIGVVVFAITLLSILYNV